VKNPNFVTQTPSSNQNNNDDDCIYTNSSGGKSFLTNSSHAFSRAKQYITIKSGDKSNNY
jgi:hypothetical protein